MTDDPVIRRRADWHPALIDYLSGVARRPHVFGTHDCALFAADAVRAMTGIDLAEAFRDAYGSGRAGLKLMRARGYRDHVAFCAAFFEEIAPAYAMPGDIAVLETPGIATLGIVQGASIYALRPDGLGLVSRREAVRAFRVP